MTGSQEVRVVGPPWALDILAANIERQADEATGHLRIEYYPGHAYLAARSDQLIVTNLIPTP